jgi:hypothetical protein
MRTRQSFAFLSILVLLLTAAPALSAPPQKVDAHWSAKMQSLYRTLASLMTDVNSDERFNDPKNRAAIEKNAKKLSELAHDLKSPGMDSPDKDPSIPLIATLFADETKRAYQYLKWGHRDYSRELLRGIPGYCISCHTRNSTGPAFSSLPLEPDSKLLNGIERGEFYASTRQYDRALREFDQVIADPLVVSAHPYEWIRAVKYALAISVRVKHDPVKSREIVLKVGATPAAPFYVKQDARHWLESVEAWSKESKITTASEEDLYSEAVRLLAEAHEAQKYPTDHSADILYLRASAATHDLLQLGPKGRHAGEGYLMAGICYEVLKTFHIGEVQDVYYEACVRTQPHSPVAQACYQRLQASIYEGFTGSGGTHIPEDQKSKLKQLEELAQPNDPGPKN